MPRKVWDKPPRRRRGGTGRNRYAGRDYYGYPQQRPPRPPRVGGFLTGKRGGWAEVLPADQPAPAVVTPRGQRVIDASELAPAVKLPELHKRADAATLTTVERAEASAAARADRPGRPAGLAVSLAARAHSAHPCRCRLRRRFAGWDRVLAVGCRGRGAPGRAARPGADRRPGVAVCA